MKHTKSRHSSLDRQECRPHLWLATCLATLFGWLAPAPAAAADVIIHTLPAVLYTVPEGTYLDPARSSGNHGDTQNHTWLFHVILISGESKPLKLETVEVRFQSGTKLLWQETFGRDYLERMEWLQGAFEMTPDYYLTKVLLGKEAMTSPDLPARGSISWLRVSFARPWYVNPDSVDLRFNFRDPQGQAVLAEKSIPIVTYHQKARLMLPFSGFWAANAGNDLSTGHRRTGLNGLTSVGWDFVKIGPNGVPYKTDGKKPEDYYTYGEPVLAAAAGTVVDVRNDIPETGVGGVPSPDVLRKDGDVWAGNFVTVDLGNGEYTFTTHMLAGSVTVKVGDKVVSGQQIGRAGSSGYAGVPHIHFNLIAGPKWLQTRGLPSLFSNIERQRTGGPPEKIALADPVTGWVVRNTESGGQK